MYEQIKNRIQERSAKVGVVGLGYVGLPLAVEFAKKGFKVFGIDVNKERVSQLVIHRKSYITDVPDRDVKNLIESGNFTATADFKKIKELDAIIICVPTPLRKTREPDISYIVYAAEKIAQFKKKGQLIVLESTSYPGTTDEVLLPNLEKDGMKLDRDFFLAFSPERVDPANPKFKTADIPKIVGGTTKKSSQLAFMLYNSIIRDIKIVSSSKTAEMVKLLENTFRSVNIGLVNELALMCNRMNINVWEVIEAAKTKPFGFMPFYPGPGLGGHCIPIDPIYLSWKARLHGFEARFIELADITNSYMPQYVVKRISELLNVKRKPLRGSKILIVGVAYKKDVSDVRESPALEIITLLEGEGCRVSYFDPYVPELKVENKILKSQRCGKGLYRGQDCVVVITDHTSVDYDVMLNESKLIFDTRNKFGSLDSKKVARL
jgi:UDP-N-acetyl-D-glucosamine dehydrogenase